MRTTFMPFSPPWIGEEEVAEVVNTLRSDWITTGPKVRQFEQAFARLVAGTPSLALNSCTAGLHTALVTLGVGPGDVVVTTPMTFCASVNVIEHVGARPVLVDVEPDTLNLDPRRVEAALGRAGGNGVMRAAAMIPVHFGGHPCEMDQLGELARRYGLVVVEDAAHALPARYKGRMVGALLEGLQSMTAFSFYATKNLTTAEGGMLTGPGELIDEARVVSLHGMSRDAWKRYSAEGSWFYEVVRPGFKYNMTDIQAAIGLRQLERLEQFQERRREIVGQYHAAFGEMEALETPVERPEVEHAWHLYVLRLNLECFPRQEERGATRNRFIEELKARNIGTSVHFIPVHLHPYYREKYGYRPDDFPVAYREFQRMLSLPLNPRMTDEDVADVIQAVRDVVQVMRR